MNERMNMIPPIITSFRFVWNSIMNYHENSHTRTTHTRKPYEKYGLWNHSTLCLLIMALFFFVRLLFFCSLLSFFALISFRSRSLTSVLMFFHVPCLYAFARLILLFSISKWRCDISTSVAERMHRKPLRAHIIIHIVHLFNLFPLHSLCLCFRFLSFSHSCVQFINYYCNQRLNRTK